MVVLKTAMRSEITDPQATTTISPFDLASSLHAASALYKTDPLALGKTDPLRLRRRGRQAVARQGVIIPADRGRLGQFWRVWMGQLSGVPKSRGQLAPRQRDQ